MLSDTLRLFGACIPVILQYGLILTGRKILAIYHRLTYRLLPQSQNVVVLGGSFTGAHLARRLAETLPSGYRVILIEKNSHFNYTFNFPRYSVVSGREGKAFVPYSGLFDKAAAGIGEIVRDKVINIREGDVVLESGKTIPYKYLAIATGAQQSPPAKLLGTEKREECGELKVLQEKIKEAGKIAVVGGGAVGVQIAGDIKTFYKEKEIVLVHSREQLLPNFGKRLHDFVLGKLKELNIEVRLGERPALPPVGTWNGAELSFMDGSTEKFDLVIPCTGQSPNSSLLEDFAPASISSQNRRVLVKRTLQLEDDSKSDNRLDSVFALGDVAETSGPRMARAGMVQAEIVQQNIVALIKGRILVEYDPIPMEGALKLSLGKDENVMYLQNDDGRDFLVPGKSKNIDLSVAQAWKMFGADMNTAGLM